MCAGSAGEEAQYQMTNTYLLTPTSFNLIGTRQLERRYSPNTDHIFYVLYVICKNNKEPIQLQIIFYVLHVIRINI
jgi:hypothetical protein